MAYRLPRWIMNDGTHIPKENPVDKDRQSILNELKDLAGRRDDLLVELTRSMELQSIWPGIFDGGRVKSRLDGNINKPETLFLVVSNVTEEKRFPLSRVPWTLVESHFERLIIQGDVEQSRRLLNVVNYHKKEFTNG